jgi:hypothetical protein
MHFLRKQGSSKTPFTQRTAVTADSIPPLSRLPMAVRSSIFALGDPCFFWRLCDANNAMRPQDLTSTIGRDLKITLPFGITGVSL